MQNGIEFEGRPVWAEVRLSALRHNLRAIRRRLHPGKPLPGTPQAHPQILAVVKANAYGHGAVAVAHELEMAGADWFGVTCSAEGVELRQGGIRKPILLLTGFWPGEEKRLLENSLTPTVIRSEQLVALNKAAASTHRSQAAFHLKIQTGMNRLGMDPAELPHMARTLAHCPHLRLEGVFTHFASSEVFSNKKTEQQQKVFEDALRQLRAMGLSAPLVHMANTAAVASRPPSWATMVRPGLVLYGYHQSYDPPRYTKQAHKEMPLRPALALRARLISVREVQRGQAVGYNGRWVASRTSRVAVISAGYADGLPRTLTNRGHVIIRGRLVPLVGTISMDLITADVTEVPNVRLGDVATIYGADGKTSQYVSDVAEQLGTVTSELCCAIGQRVPRFYLG